MRPARPKPSSGRRFRPRATSPPSPAHWQRNTGVTASARDVVVFADDDVVFDPAVFARLDETYRDPTVIGATGRVIEPASRRFGHKHDPLRRIPARRRARGARSRASAIRAT